MSPSSDEKCFSFVHEGLSSRRECSRGIRLSHAVTIAELCTKHDTFQFRNHRHQHQTLQRAQSARALNRIPRRQICRSLLY